VAGQQEIPGEPANQKGPRSGFPGKAALTTLDRTRANYQLKKWIGWNNWLA